MSLFKDKVLLITGGTGSFGNAVLNRFLKTDIGEIRIFSRDEKKQDDMRHDFQARMPEVASKIKFYIGDVRNRSTLHYAMQGVDYVFHAAALKQVPSCEFFPMEAVKTNVIGTDNTLDAAIDAGVKCVICLSTDKAAYPINAMGITKAIEEKIAVAKSRLSGNTKICCTRYGNVMCSRGSVIPLWIDQIRKGNPITLTEPKMTRFIMSLEEAVDLVLFALSTRLHHPDPGRGSRGAFQTSVPCRRRSRNPRHRHPSWREDVRDPPHQGRSRQGHRHGQLLCRTRRQPRPELRQVLQGWRHKACHHRRVQ